jgi:hypothetical protein
MEIAPYKPMTKKQLIEKLSKYSDGHIVIISADPEGSNYDTVVAVEEGWWDPASYEYLLDDEVDEDEKDEFERCVCIWP